MGQARTITYELKLGNLLDVLYGIKDSLCKYGEGVEKIGPVLRAKTSKGDEPDYHECSSTFLKNHLSAKLVDQYLLLRKDGKTRVNSQLLQDIYGRPQNTELINGGGKRFQSHIIEEVRGNLINDMVALINKTISEMDTSQFFTGISEYIQRIPEAEKGEKSDKYRINPVVLSDYLGFINCLFARTEKQKECIAEVIAWLIIGCILRHRLTEIQELFSPGGKEFPGMDSAEVQRGMSGNRFQEIIDSIDTTSEYTGKGFYYKNPEFTLYGRDDEYKQLDCFLFQKENILWTAVTGNSGVGKSKLMHSYLKSISAGYFSGEWKCIMVDADRVFDFLECKHWNYPKKLLIVFDYAGETAQEIGRWMFRLQASGIQNKIRIVLIERDGILHDNEMFADPAWYSELIGRHEQKRVIESLHFENDSKYKSIHLSGVDLTAGIEIIEEYIDNHDRIHKANYDCEEIYIAAKEIDSPSIYPRPVIVLFTTDAFIRNKDARKWDMDTLTEYIKDKIMGYWKNGIFKNDGATVYDEMTKLLLYASCTGRLDIESEENMNSYFETAREMFMRFSSERKEQILQSLNIGNQSPLVLCPLEPDLIGEKFVLDSFLKLHCKGKIGTIADDLLDRYPKSFSRCLIRCISDYYEIDRYEVLFKNAMAAWNINIEKLSEEAALAWSRVLLQLAYWADNQEVLACKNVIQLLDQRHGTKHPDFLAKIIFG